MYMRNALGSPWVGASERQRRCSGTTVANELTSNVWVPHVARISATLTGVGTEQHNGQHT